MATALGLAGADASRDPSGRSSLLDRIDELTAIPSFVWHVPDPAHAVAAALGLAPAATRLTSAGGTVPQSALFDAAGRIARGELEVAAIVGGEAMKSRDLARKGGVAVEWHAQGDDVVGAPIVFEVPDALDDHERAAGLALPVHTYALFEHALRRSKGLSRSDHLGVLAALARRMSAVAEHNPSAWLRDAAIAASATTPGPTNRVVSFPYTKLLTSNVVVDMGAALLVCSLGAARDAGVPDDQLVFPVKGAAAKEQWLVSTRRELSQSLAMRACAHALFGEAPPSPDELGHLDLYSCFPSAVQMASDALGLDLLFDTRPPSVTGGMTFFGGPGNNYVTHSLATMVEKLRSSPGATGLVTGLGWYASTHSWGTYSTVPPLGGFRAHDVQAAVDAAPLRDVDPDYRGEADVEAYTVAHDRDGSPARLIASLRTPAGARRLVASTDAQLAARFEAADPLFGRVGVEGAAITLR